MASLDLSNLTMLEFHYHVMNTSQQIYLVSSIVILIVLCIILHIQRFTTGLNQTDNILICQIIKEMICMMMQRRKHWMF